MKKNPFLLKDRISREFKTYSDFFSIPDKERDNAKHELDELELMTSIIVSYAIEAVQNQKDDVLDDEDKENVIRNIQSFNANIRAYVSSSKDWLQEHRKKTLEEVKKDLEEVKKELNAQRLKTLKAFNDLLKVKFQGFEVVLVSLSDEPSLTVEELENASIDAVKKFREIRGEQIERASKHWLENDKLTDKEIEQKQIEEWFEPLTFTMAKPKNGNCSVLVWRVNKKPTSTTQGVHDIDPINAGISETNS